MYYPVLLLPNGTELKGGSPGSAVKNLTLHTAVLKSANAKLLLQLTRQSCRLP